MYSDYYPYIIMDATQNRWYCFTAHMWNCEPIKSSDVIENLLTSLGIRTLVN